MFSVGEALKRARLERDLDLASVSAQTKISANYLEALESDDRKKLPGGFFYKSFVHQYANFLGVDLKEMDAEIERQLATDEPLPLPGQGRAASSRDLPPLALMPRLHKRRLSPSFVMLMLVVVACSAVYGLWRNTTTTAAPSVAAKPPAVESPTAPKQQEPKPADVAAASNSETSPQAVPEQPAEPAPSAPVPSEPPQATDPQPENPKDYKVLVDLMAKEATWLSVSSDGKPVFSGTLAANETKTIEGRQFAKVKVGNAAGLEVRLNGKMLGPLGARGQVLIVVFTPDNFQIVSPAREGD